MCSLTRCRLISDLAVRRRSCSSPLAMAQLTSKRRGRRARPTNDFNAFIRKALDFEHDYSERLDAWRKAAEHPEDDRPAGHCEMMPGPHHGGVAQPIESRYQTIIHAYRHNRLCEGRPSARERSRRPGSCHNPPALDRWESAKTYAVEFKR